nr:collagen alpha-2(I) chain-like [Microcebus murinus]
MHGAPTRAGGALLPATACGAGYSSGRVALPAGLEDTRPPTGGGASLGCGPPGALLGEWRPPTSARRRCGRASRAASAFGRAPEGRLCGEKASSHPASMRTPPELPGPQGLMLLRLVSNSCCVFLDLLAIGSSFTL